MNFKNLKNLYELFQIQSCKFKKNSFLHSIKDDKSIKSLTWHNVSEKVLSISHFLKKQGVAKGDRVMLVSEGRPEWMISDLAIIGTGAITVPNYTTYTQKDFEFVLNHFPNSSAKIEGAKGLKLSLYFTFKFKFFCILSDLGSPKIDLPPKALGPNSILP